MTKPGFGGPNLAGGTDAIIGAAGGLFAVAIPNAILTRDIHALSMSALLLLSVFSSKRPSFGLSAARSVRASKAGFANASPELSVALPVDYCPWAVLSIGAGE